MSFGMIVLLIVIAVVALVVGHITASTKKRFGLKEAKAAARYVGGSPDSARAIMGVVLGVLDYQNTVAEDVRALAEEKSRENAASTKSIEANEAEMARLEAESESLHGQIAANEAEVADAGQMAALFRG